MHLLMYLASINLEKNIGRKNKICLGFYTISLATNTTSRKYYEDIYINASVVIPQKN